MTTRGSILNDYNSVLNAVTNATSIKDALSILGLRAAGGNYKAFRNSCLNFNISVPSYSRTGQAGRERIPNDDVFVENSTYNNRTALKKRLFELGIPNICNECGQEPFWNGKPLVLTLEHINGVWNDNRLDNLSILCGHCHSQTETFCGKSRPKIAKVRIPKSRPTKIEWPGHESLQDMVDNFGFVATGKELGVSDNAVRKRLKTFALSTTS